MRAFLAICFLLFVSVYAEEDTVEVENPPPAEENDGEFSWIPDKDDNLYRVNTAFAMSEPIPHFSPRFAVRFELFTPENDEQAQLLNAVDEDALHGSNFNPNRPTRFVTHGWNSRGYLTNLFRGAFLVNGTHDVNLIIVNWRAGADTINYVGARRRVGITGRYVAQFIDFLVRVGNLNLKTTTLIGHSLGAHVSGIAGKNIRSGRLGKIVALDPAAPLFNYADRKTRVASGDADYVESMHTNAGLLGFTQPIGDASFYPNGGRSQPGCGMDVAGACAHGRSYKFLAESIESNYDFRTYHCRSFEQLQRGRCSSHAQTVRMGGEPGNFGNAAARGVFFLRTNRAAPFIIPGPVPATANN